VAIVADGRKLPREKEITMMNYYPGADDEPPGFEGPCGFGPCVLCGQPLAWESGVLAMFVPNDVFARRIGEPAGACLFYKLCDDCVRRTDLHAAVEADILRKFPIRNPARATSALSETRRNRRGYRRR
jgi:hypothetical protein